MKYMDIDLYSKTCKIDNNEEYEKLFNEKCEEYLIEFNKISNRLPIGFLKEYEQNGLHDMKIISLQIVRKELKKRFRYDLQMILLDYKNSKHIIDFVDVKNVKTNMNFSSSAGLADWIYCEILAAGDKRLSIEVLLFSDSTLYFDFVKMHYKNT